MPHETTRPCLNCAMRRLIAQYHIDHGYKVHELLNNTAEVIADMAACSALAGHETDSHDVMLQLLGIKLMDAYAREAQHRAEAASGPKEPTVRGCGHA